MIFYPTKTPDILVRFVLILVLLLVDLSLVKANDTLLEFRVNDYYLSHTSNDPFYERHKLDPSVVLHLHEVILPGRERTVAKDGKVLVLIHGYSFPGAVAFDMDHENVSLMRHFARLGWDTFALDLEGYGSSTRPMIMDNPEAYPDEPAPLGLDAMLADVDRVVDFVRDLRGVDKVHVLGWSQGASVEAPHYTAQNPDKVASLVLYGVRYRKVREPEARQKSLEKYNARKVAYSRPSSMNGWFEEGTKAEFLVPGAFTAYSKAHLASDPKSGELGGRVRVPLGRLVYVVATDTHFDPAKITVPTLVIRGDADTYAKHDDNSALMEALGSEIKQFVEIPNAGHFLHFEKVNLQFYQALQDFWEREQ